jgi:uncharacterized protein YegP (UPF0339 family)
MSNPRKEALRAYVQLFQDRAGCWRWRLRASGNGQILASSEAYASERNAKKTALRLAAAHGMIVEMPLNCRLDLRGLKK